jgi:hypothetical protein
MKYLHQTNTWRFLNKWMLVLVVIVTTSAALAETCMYVLTSSPKYGNTNNDCAVGGGVLALQVG